MQNPIMNSLLLSTYSFIHSSIHSSARSSIIHPFIHVYKVVPLTLFYSDPRCVPPPRPPHNVRCKVCDCLFPHTNCLQQHHMYCSSVLSSLGYCCGPQTDPLTFILESCPINSTLPGSSCFCALSRMCPCQSRGLENVELEEFCNTLCMNDSHHEGVFHHIRKVCDPAHKQFCRRPGLDRSQLCAQMCSQEDSCVRHCTLSV